MGNVLFRAIQEHREWSGRSEFACIEAALFASAGGLRSAESLWSGRGYAAKKNYGVAYYAAIWERPAGDTLGNGYLVFKKEHSIRFIPVPVHIFEDMENNSKKLGLDDFKAWGTKLVKEAEYDFPLEWDMLRNYALVTKNAKMTSVGQGATEGKNWTDKELRAAVVAYLEMYRRRLSGEMFVKKQYYSSLAKQFGRSEKAFEYRMQNISYVRSLMGRDWLNGLPPAKNVGANVAAQIEALINELEHNPTAPIVEFEIQVRDLLNKVLKVPEGTLRPKKIISQTTQYDRDPKVKAWIIQQVANRCESCDESAPFVDDSGLPFLELHHLRRLADGGSDTITNAVLLCPNCHRALHYGFDRKSRLETIYAQVARLIKE